MRRVLAAAVRVVCDHVVHNQAVDTGRAREAARPLLMPRGRPAVRVVRIAAVHVVYGVLVVVLVNRSAVVRFLVGRLRVIGRLTVVGLIIVIHRIAVARRTVVIALMIVRRWHRLIVIMVLGTLHRVHRLLRVRRVAL